MIGQLPKPKRNRNAGKQPRAIWYRRWARMLKRKRVAFVRAQLCATLARAQRLRGRLQYLAEAHEIPLGQIPWIKPVPMLPGQHWVELKQAIGPLKAPVKPARPEPQQEQVMA